MRVLIISQLPPPVHGSTVMTETLVAALNHNEHDVTVLQRRFSSTVAEVGTFSVKKLGSAILMPARLIALVLYSRPSVAVFFATNRKFSFLVDVVLAQILRVLVRRRVFYIHTVGFAALAQKGRLWEMCVSTFLRSATQVVCLGDSLSRDVDDWVESDRIQVIPNAVRPPERGQPDAQIGAAHPDRSVVYLSNLIREKGVMDFVELVPRLSSRSDVTFEIAGASSSSELDAELRQALASADLGGHVSLLGPVHGDEKWSLLSRASVLVFPSTYPFEAQPLTILEAFACSTPVIAYPTGGIKDVVVHGRNGLIVEEATPAGIVRDLERLLDSPDELAALSSGARDSFVRCHSFDAYAAAWHRLLSEERVDDDRK